MAIHIRLDILYTYTLTAVQSRQYREYLESDICQPSRMTKENNNNISHTRSIRSVCLSSSNSTMSKQSIQDPQVDMLPYARIRQHTPTTRYSCQFSGCQESWSCLNDIEGSFAGRFLNEKYYKSEKPLFTSIDIIIRDDHIELTTSRQQAVRTTLPTHLPRLHSSLLHPP